MRKLSIVVALLAVALDSAQAQFESYLDHEANIVVTNMSPTNPIKLFGIEFRSEAGALQFGSPAPFSTTLDPSSTYVPLLDPSGDVEIDGSITFDIKHNFVADPVNDLQVTVSPVSGQGFGAQVSASVIAVAHDPIDPIIPEPSASLLATLGALGLLGLRRRR